MQRAIIPQTLSNVAVIVLCGGEILKYREKCVLPTFYYKISTVFHSTSAFQFVCVCNLIPVSQENVRPCNHERHFESHREFIRGQDALVV